MAHRNRFLAPVCPIKSANGRIVIRFDRYGVARRVSPVALGIAAISALTLAGSAHAQADPGSPPAQLPTPSPPTTQGGDVESRRADAPLAADSESAKFEELNKLVLKGWATTVPTFGDTVDRDLGG